MSTADDFIHVLVEIDRDGSKILNLQGLANLVEKEEYKIFPKDKVRSVKLFVDDFPECAKAGLALWAVLPRYQTKKRSVMVHVE